MQSLIEEAKRKYPIGTVIRSPQSGTKFTINGNNFTMDGENIRGNGAGGYTPFLYFKDKWAEIISLPEPEIESYPIY